MRHITDSFAVEHGIRDWRFVVNPFIIRNIDFGKSVICRIFAVRFYRKSAAEYLLAFMRIIPTLVVLFCTLSGCGPARSTRADVERLALEAVHAPIPAQASEVFGREVAAFTRTIDIRFRCSEEQFSEFLAKARNVEQRLLPRARATVDSMCSEAWWQPDRLRNVRGSTFDLTKDKQIGHCSIMVGSDDGAGVVVYLTATVETQG